MSDQELRLNVYNGSKSGHANVSFYKNGEHQYTIGANIRIESLGLALPQVFAGDPNDGIYRDESAFYLAAIAEGEVITAALPVTTTQYDGLLNVAYALENKTFNYSLFTEACTDLVEDFYTATGHPGEFGDLFPADVRSGSRVWDRVPVSELANVWPEHLPYYAPTKPVISDGKASASRAPLGDPQWAGAGGAHRPADNHLRSASEVTEIDTFDGDTASGAHQTSEGRYDYGGHPGFGLVDPAWDDSVVSKPVGTGVSPATADLTTALATFNRPVTWEGDEPGALEIFRLPDVSSAAFGAPYLPADEPEFQFREFGNQPSDVSKPEGNREGERRFAADDEPFETTSGQSSASVSDDWASGLRLGTDELSFGTGTGGDFSAFERLDASGSGLSFNLGREILGAEIEFGMNDAHWDF